MTKEAEDDYRAIVVDAQGNPQAEHPFSLQFNTLKMREDLKRLEELSLSSEKVKDDFHIRFGRMLYHKVFSDSLGDCLSQRLKQAVANKQSLRIRIRIDGTKAPELRNIPWELLHA